MSSDTQPDLSTTVSPTSLDTSKTSSALEETTPSLQTDPVSVINQPWQKVIYKPGTYHLKSPRLPQEAKWTNNSEASNLPPPSAVTCSGSAVGHNRGRECSVYEAETRPLLEAER